MARAYSVDLRTRVIEAALGDGSIRQAARRFGVGITTATRWVRRWREHGESSARRQGKPRGSCLDPHRDDLLALVEQTRDLTLARDRGAPASRAWPERGHHHGLEVPRAAGADL